MKNSQEKKLINAKEIIEKSTRFDLIFKYLYVANVNKATSGFYKKLYLKSIECFNSFYEEDPPKNNSQDFLDAFDQLIQSVSRQGFDLSISNITITKNLDLYDGAHRLSVCAEKNLEICPLIIDEEVNWDYTYFAERGLPEWMSDYVAYEFSQLSRYSYIALVHSCTPTQLDNKIEEIMIEHECKIYYKKLVNLSPSGYINLKKICYGNDDWIGDKGNSFNGAAEHAKMSYGPYCLRAYVLISEDINNITQMKSRIREMVGLGNASIHVTDGFADKKDLAQVVLSDNTIQALNGIDVNVDFRSDYASLRKLKKAISDNGELAEGDFCVVGSYPMAVLGIRECRDMDYLSLDNVDLNAGDNIDLHDTEDEFYLNGWLEQIVNPTMYFYLHSVKIMTLASLFYYKCQRREYPKDARDIELLHRYLSSSYVMNSKPYIDPSHNISLKRQITNKVIGRLKRYGAIAKAMISR